MQPPPLVSDYLDRLVGALRFDGALAQRVRREAEDHLLEALADAPDDGSPDDAQRRAIDRFGDPRAIARQYAAASLQRQTRRAGATLIIVTAAIVLAMRGRAAWYGLMQWGLCADFVEIARIGMLIDRYAFMLAFAIGLVGWAYIGSRGAIADLRGTGRAQVRRGMLLCTAAAVPLIGSVLSDALLTGLRLATIEPSAAALVPLAAMAAEAALAAALIVVIWRTIRRAAFADHLIGG